jgi:SAM-dependent methyltransferase
MDWKHGYYADSGYTFGFYAETMPNRLRYAGLIQGQALPREKFRYLDAGCGQGFNLIVAAACHPDSEFVGVDFLPEHIAHANQLAKRCGLSNIQFFEKDFVKLAKDPLQLGQFDYAICHGITTWIAPQVQEALFSWIGETLKPGGIFYNSYNTFPGWLAAVPFQHLVLLEQRTKTGSLALKSARQNMESLKTSSPGLFSTLPNLETRLKTMEIQDPAYLVQEYNNQFWQPVFVTEMMDKMSAVKLRYLGTATLPEAYDSAISGDVKNLLASQTDPHVREQIRDYALIQSFRRDLYVKGQNKPWQREAEALLREFRVIRNPVVDRPEGGKHYAVKVGALEVNGVADFYNSLVDFVEKSQEGRSIGEIIDVQTTQQYKMGVAQAISMLLHGGWLNLFDSDAPTAEAKSTNCEITLSVAKGAPYHHIVLPKSGCALPVGDTEWVMYGAAAKGTPYEQWPQLVATDLAARGRQLVRDGKPVSDTKEQSVMLKKGAEEFKQKKLPFLKLTGAIDCVD